MSAKMEFSEARVAHELGVAREEIAAIRKKELFEKDHWFRRGRQMFLTKAGLEELAKILASKSAPKAEKKAPPTPTPTFQEKPAPEAVAPQSTPSAKGIKEELVSRLESNGLVLVRVTKLFAKAPRIMFGEKDGKQVRIKVRESKNFMVGMEIPCRHQHDEVYAFEGRLPRKKGRLAP